MPNLFLSDGIRRFRDEWPSRYDCYGRHVLMLRVRFGLDISTYVHKRTNVLVLEQGKSWNTIIISCKLISPCVSLGTALTVWLQRGLLTAS